MMALLLLLLLPGKDSAECQMLKNGAPMAICSQKRFW
jgi:hypothetical protein